MGWDKLRSPTADMGTGLGFHGNGVSEPMSLPSRGSTRYCAASKIRLQSDCQVTPNAFISSSAKLILALEINFLACFGKEEVN